MRALHCGAHRLLSSCGVWASELTGSVLAACRLSSCGVQALELAGSVVAVHGFSCPAACGILETLVRGSSEISNRETDALFHNTMSACARAHEHLKLQILHKTRILSEFGRMSGAEAEG